MAEQAVLFVLMSLASYRAWRLIGYDDVTESARERLDQEGKLYDLVTCPWCLGSWIAFAVVASTATFTVVWVPWLQGFAVATVVGWLGNRIE